METSSHVEKNSGHWKEEWVGAYQWHRERYILGIPEEICPEPWEWCLTTYKDLDRTATNGTTKVQLWIWPKKEGLCINTHLWNNKPHGYPYAEVLFHSWAQDKVEQRVRHKPGNTTVFCNSSDETLKAGSCKLHMEKEKPWTLAFSGPQNV